MVITFIINIQMTFMTQRKNKTQQLTMAISNCLFSPTSENPLGFSAWCVLAKFRANSRNYS